MNRIDLQESLLTYRARPNDAAHQDTLPGRYRWWVMVLSMAAFTLAFLGWLNESWLYLFESPIWLNRYTEYAIILAFGLWRIRAEHNPYTRRRLIILVTVVTVLWWLIPWLTPMFEPYAGFVWSQPVFPALHTPGTLTFFLTLLLVFLFGRRIICGFGCPCVGIRETVGFPLRRMTLRGDWAWRLRHTKWFFFIWYVGVMVSTQFPPNAWTATLVGGFAMVVGLTYFGTFFLAPSPATASTAATSALSALPSACSIMPVFMASGWTQNSVSTANAVSRPVTWVSRCGGKAGQQERSAVSKTAWAVPAVSSPALPMHWPFMMCATCSGRICGRMPLIC